MAWAIEQKEVKDPVSQFVLLSLANYAAADGTSAFPSLGRLASDTRLSERTVRAHLRKLEKLILIRKGNQAIAAAHIKRSDHRPTVYDLLMSRGAADSPRSDTGGISRRNGGNMTADRGAPPAPDPKIRDPIRDPREDFIQDFKKRFGKEPR